MRLPRPFTLPPADPVGPGLGGLLLLAFSCFLGAYLLLCQLVGLGPGEAAPAPVEARLMAGVWASVGLAILWGAARLPGGRAALGLAPRRWSGRTLGGGVLVLLAGYLVLFPVVVAYYLLLRACQVPVTAQPVYEELARGMAGGRPDLELILLVVLVYPFFEELAFRGLLQAFGRRYLPRLAALLLAAALFALLHSPWIMVFPIFLLGLLFGYARERTGSFWASWAAHLVHNALSVAFSPWLIRFYDAG